ncbi:hypothetical protein GN958_ATG02973 [Phytophthora infestans]|uniref:Uncharacterized protein n=1 Tax=Phytophthora infestans TaxID=4787 RepID=A0A8S9V4E9_PHYIN|nr:hypothetical protein GN958_ATG22307 [Phytophthora infestans]KAF4147840.1 hypothetical protein GN958_ATG02973 [Phytophthora infestans]
MGAAREKRRAERIVEGGTPTWRQTWSELRASGWTHKKPHANSIETRWKLIPPGGKARGIEGTVHVLGEERECAQYTSVHSMTAVEALGSACAAKGRCMSALASTNPSRPARYDRIDRNFLEFCYLPCQSASTSPVNGDIVDIRTSKDRDDEFELVPRDRALRPRFSADTSIGTSLFGPSDEDDSDDEVTIFDDDDGDFDNDNADSLISSDVEDNLNKIEGGEDPNDIGGPASDE